MQANKAKAQEIGAMREELNSKLAAEESKSTAAEKLTAELKKQLSTKEEELGQVGWISIYIAAWLLILYQVQTRLKDKEEQHSSTQTELDDLLMVFGDLEEKVEKYKVKPRHIRL